MSQSTFLVNLDGEPPPHLGYITSSMGDIYFAQGIHLVPVGFKLLDLSIWSQRQ